MENTGISREMDAAEVIQKEIDSLTQMSKEEIFC